MRETTRPRAALSGAAALECLVLAGFLAWSLVPAGSAWGVPVALRGGADAGGMSAAEYARVERGYYERLLAPDRSLDALAGSARGLDRHGLPRAEDVCGEVGRLMQPVDDVRERVLRPDLTARAAGASWSTNGLGLRDRPYAQAKPSRTCRIVLAGDSIAAGWGVDDGVGFEPLLERALGTRSTRAGGPAVELINLSAPGYSAGARWEQMRRVGWPLAPDLVLFEATVADFGWDERRLRWLLAWGIGWDVPQYRAALAAAAVRPGANARTYQRALKPYRERLLAGVYEAAAAECRMRGVPCVWVLLPRVGRRDDSDARRRLVALARRAGFTAVVDVSDAYDGIAPETLAVGPGDYHPNARGHALLARRLEGELGAQLSDLKGGDATAWGIAAGWRMSKEKNLLNPEGAQCMDGGALPPGTHHALSGLKNRLFCAATVLGRCPRLSHFALSGLKNRMFWAAGVLGRPRLAHFAPSGLKNRMFWAAGVVGRCPRLSHFALSGLESAPVNAPQGPVSIGAVLEREDGFERPHRPAPRGARFIAWAASHEGASAP